MSVLSCPFLSCPVLLWSVVVCLVCLVCPICLVCPVWSVLSIWSALSVWSVWSVCMVWSFSVVPVLFCSGLSGLSGLVWSGLSGLVYKCLGGSSRGYCSNLVCLVWFCLSGRVSWGRLSSS